MVRVKRISEVATDLLKRKYDKNSSFSGLESRKSPKSRRKSLGAVLPTPAKPKKVKVETSHSEWTVVEEHNIEATPSRRKRLPKVEAYVKKEPSLKASTPKSVKKKIKSEPTVPLGIKKKKTKTIESFVETSPAPIPKTEDETLKLQSHVANTPSVEDLEQKFNIKATDIAKAVQGVIKFRSENPKLQNELFDERFPVYLQVSCHHIPRTNSRIIRIPLPHPTITSDDEVCLIVPDVKGIKNAEHEKHLEHYEDLLRSKGVTNIKKIMTFHEFRTEYETFEQKSRLVNLYDSFLVDGRLSGKAVKKSGKIFYKKRKVPTSVNLAAPNLKDHIDKGLSKVFFHLHLKGNSHIVQFGHSKMDVAALTENILTIIEYLSKTFPGGFDNFKGIQVYATRATSIPIYMSLKSPAEVVVTKAKPKRPKAYKTYTDELSTRLKSNVTVRPSGQVIVKQIGRINNDSEVDEKSHDGEDSEVVIGDDVGVKDGVKKKERKAKGVKEVSVTDTEAPVAKKRKQKLGTGEVVVKKKRRENEDVAEENGAIASVRKKEKKRKVGLKVEKEVNEASKQKKNKAKKK